jgi:alkylation response protein AidB-like acyl-CoA dehydrogenase
MKRLALLSERVGHAGGPVGAIGAALRPAVHRVHRERVWQTALAVKFYFFLKAILQKALLEFQVAELTSQKSDLALGGNQFEFG